MASNQRYSALQWAVFALLVSVGLVAAKMVAFFLTGSSAILSDALESLVNIVTSGFALFAVWLSAQPRDREHPYGHGKIEYLSAGIEGMLVIVAGIVIMAVSVWRVFNPPELQALGLGAGLTLVTTLISGAVGYYLIKVGRELESPSLEADGVHLRSDAVTSLGATFGVVLVMITDIVIIDAIVAGLLAIWLLWEGFGVVRRAVGGILDEASPDLLNEIAEVLEEVREEGWTAPHHAKVHRLGQTIHIDLHMVFPRYWTIEETHEASVIMERAIRRRFGAKAELMVHMEACRPQGCASCDMSDCPLRESEFVGRDAWTGERIALSVRHK